VFALMLLTTTFLSVLGASSLIHGLSELNQSTYTAYQAEAFHLAEAAIDDAIRNVSGGTITNLSSTSLGAGTYWAEVDNSLGANRYVITAHGSSTSLQTNVEAILEIVPLKSYDYGIQTQSTVNIAKLNVIDSYDSGNGGYGGANVGSNGHLATNATGAGSMVIGKDSIVDGTLYVGVGGNPATDITLGSGATVGGTDTLDVAATLTPETFAGGGATGPLTVASFGSQELSAGTYSYTSLELGQSASLSITGNVTLYVEEYFHLGQGSSFTTNCEGSCTVTIYVEGGSDPAVLAVQVDQGSTFSAGNKPTDLVVYVTGDGGAQAGAVQFNQNNGFYGVIDAPLSDVFLDRDAQLFGAVVGYLVSSSQGVTIHYDEALSGGLSSASGSVQLLSWREL